jgi:hypothetical protein
MLLLGLLSLPAVQAQYSTTMLRFGCAQVTIDRIDPYVVDRLGGETSSNKNLANVAPVLSNPATSPRRTSTRLSEV